MLGDIRAKIVITNYHAFKLRERSSSPRAAARCCKGRGGGAEDARDRRPDAPAGDARPDGHEEHPGHQRRGAPLLPREAETDADDEELKGDEKKEAEKNNEAAPVDLRPRGRQPQARVSRVIDLSATPFFLRGSGYAEGTLFPWTMSDFSLMDAIECGIVKLPRVPVADNIPGDEMPMFRNLWEHIGKNMPKKGRGKGGSSTRSSCRRAADRARSALRPLREDLRAVGSAASRCRPASSSSATTRRPRSWSTTTSPAFQRENEDGSSASRTAACRCSATSTRHGNPLARPNTLLIDSEQLESGDALDDNFRGMAADEIERFRREIVERTGDARAADNITDQELLREVMNTVGKPGQLGGAIRCVVSVSMLTEGWDANTVTHVLGVRAFGTQLLCEQVIGRALRRQSYELNEEGCSTSSTPTSSASRSTSPPSRWSRRRSRRARPSRSRRAPERDALEIRFPRVEGYRVELPEER
jgi:type III restriction enzyme